MTRRNEGAARGFGAWRSADRSPVALTAFDCAEKITAHVHLVADSLASDDAAAPSPQAARWSAEAR
ncbi:hypothetical protein BURCENBC7_AP2689 [Burkholderia cenocepacia BC7]|nr:hypothetical protein BURCENK562V_C3607 [Burkholderia cenocepacia K56-2Valvano]ERI27621.1 hypothetical protein BURCENBC7_AP2689 [Burkholderia cenocepacia BC7]SOT43575.1 conserved hypothetical protein [Burkholderia cenocepacia]